VFTDEEVIELSELYYAAKAGGSVPFENFIAAIDRVAEKGEAIKQIKDNPIGIRRENLEYYNIGKPHSYTDDELNIDLTHRVPEGKLDKAAYYSCQAVRKVFDMATGWRMDNIRVDNTLNRVIYLETIAAVPGMVAAVVRHFRSLRQMKSDGGMLQMFLEEANNERMHLLTFVRMKDPGYAFRAAVIGGQFGFGAAFTLAYLISPAFCHRFVGYVEEEACSTYTKIIKTIETAPEGSEIAKWRTEAPPGIARAYWKLGEGSTVLDLMKAVRADEAEHRDVNHLMSGMKEGETNPYYDPEYKLNTMLSKYIREIMTRPGLDENKKLA
jgi:ribosomal protein L31E